MAVSLKIYEKVLHLQICKYIDAKYPKIIYLSDASGIRIGSAGLRNELKAKRCKKWKIPDLIILHPVYNKKENKQYCGLILEIKVSISDIFKKDLSLKANDHVKEQAKTIERLNEIGYKAAFACGFDDTVRKIDNYLKSA